MKGIIKGFIYSAIRKTTTVELELEGNQCAEFEKYQGKHIDIALKQYRKKRSLNANSYAWLLIGKLSEVLDKPSVEIYREYIKTIGVYRDIDIAQEAEPTVSKVWCAYGLGWLTEKVDFASAKDNVTLRLFYGSSVYNTKQMSMLIDCIAQDCKALDIETQTPQQIADMVSLWESVRKC